MSTEEPPLYGDIEFTLPISPISSQSKKEARDRLTAEVRSFTKPLNYVLTGDVGIEIGWLVPGRLRYESDVSPDLENITKPLLDSLCGADGILIDDCQVKSFGSEWIDWVREDQKISVRIKFSPGEWTLKKDLFFLHLGKGLCAPFEGYIEEPVKKIMVDAYKSGLKHREVLEKLAGRDFITRKLIPAHRLFHRTRIHGYKVVDINDL